MTLLDLSMTYQRNASMGVASSILGRMGTFARLHKKSVEQAAFVVLKSPDMPALLVETGFISNPEEEAKLITAAYQRQMAGAILAGIKEYFSKHPPASAPQPVLRQATHDELPEPVVLLASNAVTPASSAATGRLANSVVPADMVARPPLNPVTLPKPASPQATGAKTAATKTASAATPQKATAMTYVIRRGDTLSEIASQNGVAIAELRRVNGLRSDQIRIGQTLKIPKS
jgi:N-acetylmuramoyl-L-alanine amidase